jgi:hypothetical protein
MVTWLLARLSAAITIRERRNRKDRQAKTPGQLRHALPEIYGPRCDRKAEIHAASDRTDGRCECGSFTLDTIRKR